MVLLADGKDSPIFKEFFAWAAYFVDESRRSFQVEAYNVLAELPLEYALKLAWSSKDKQKTQVCVCCQQASNTGLMVSKSGNGELSWMT